ncbi:hypothetical protein GCM10027612_44080 [Microbispora bryophytorum subsp. camponoti]
MGQCHAVALVVALVVARVVAGRAVSLLITAPPRRDHAGDDQREEDEADDGGGPVLVDRGTGVLADGRGSSLLTPDAFLGSASARLDRGH